jgi:tetratricopeptide (TPR) repeat protein
LIRHRHGQRTPPQPTTGPLVFVSYSHKDKRWKDELLPHLKALELDNQLAVWADDRIDVGGAWRDEIVQALNRSGVAVCLVSKHFLSSEFVIRQEVKHFLEQARRSGLPILPILLAACPWESIAWLSGLQMLPGGDETIEDDYPKKYNKIFAKLANRVSAIAKDLRFAPPPPQEEEIPQIVDRAGIVRQNVSISGHDNLTIQVFGSANVIEFRDPTEPAEIPARIGPAWPALAADRIDIDRLPVTGSELFGRQAELALLDEAWASDKTNVVSLVAWGGVGKSTLVNKWLEALEADNWRGASRVLGWSFYSQGTGERASSADLFIDHALRLFGDPDPTEGSPWSKGERLAELVGKNKALLVLDGLEPLQDPYQGVKDPGLQRLIEGLARDNAGLCVITTREPVTELADFPDSATQRNLEQISPEAGRALLRVKGVRGTDAELEKASAAFGNHALAINLLANFLRAIPDHPIARAYNIPDLDIPPEQGRHPRRMMAGFAERFGEHGAEVELLRLLGLFDRPATAGAIAALRKPPPITELTDHLSGLDEAGWLRLLERLREAGLVAPKSHHPLGEVDAHPLVREHFGAGLREKNQTAWRAGHERLYEYFKALPEKYQPDTLEELAPLFQAVFHGCQAGRHQEALDEVFRPRIGRGKKTYVVRELGAIGADLAALSGFFEPPWEKPVASITGAQQGFVLHAAGFDLRALRRLKEAVRATRASLEMAISRSNAAVAAGILSELHLTLGEVTEAIALAEQSVDHADRSGDVFQRMVRRTTLAYALHQAGERAGAQGLFDEAERLQVKDQPQYPRLYSFRGYQYCDLLLELGRHADVRDRAAQTLGWVERHKLLFDIALDHLSLGRAELMAYEADQSGDLIEAEAQLNAAVDGLRKAGQIDDVPRGLLARAAYFRVVGLYDRARRDLDEAMRIATRSGMRLFECDAHLELAWLAVAEGEPDARDHLARAAALVQKTGYHRRDGEVQKLRDQLGQPG